MIAADRAAPVTCDCTALCMRSIRKDGRVCAPKNRYFEISRVRWVRGVDGEPERDDIHFPQKYATLGEAMDQVRKLVHPDWDYIVDDTPRMGMFPAYRGPGGPSARAEGETVVSDEDLATVT